MAIAKIKHIDIFSTQDKKEEVLKTIQKLGVIQLLQLKETQAQIKEEFAQGPSEELEEAIAYLESISIKKGLLYLKPSFKKTVLDGLLKEFDLDSIIKRLKRIKGRLKAIQTELDKLNSSENILIPWQNLQLPLKDIGPTEHVEVALGTINKTQLNDLEEEIKTDNLNLHLELVNEKGRLAYILVIYLKEEAQSVDIFFKKYNFNQVNLPRLEEKPADVILGLDTDIDELHSENKKLLDEASLLLPEKIKLMALADRFNNEKILKDASMKLLETHYVSLISGWMRERDLPFLKKWLSRFTDLEILTRDPKTDEDVPVALENKKLIQPFEFITRIYGMPKYTELDPTPFLAPFFFLYFGFCVSDVGYGFLLALISSFILKKFKMGPDGVRFFRLFLFCGISTIIVGALTGSWFGNLFDVLTESNKIFSPLKRFKDSLIILNPLRQPTKLLGIALSFGIVQVWFGNIVAALGNIKNKRYLDVLLDQVPMLTFLFGLTGLGLIFLRLLDAGQIGLFKYATSVASVVLVLTQGRSERGIGSKLFYGIYNLYSSFSGYLSDVLSYSRLWALGLVTGVMATTINLVSMQLGRIIPEAIPFINKINFIRIIIGGVVLIVIFVFGHLISFLMNLLGAFVHPLRLQFVEFFPKFFKSSGSSFRPFKIDTKYIRLE